MPDSRDTRYGMSISLGILDHLGLNLYSNTPAVISEAIANAWDADATRVEVSLDHNENTITVADNGHGMDLAEVNNRYLRVGYRRREEQGNETPNGRKPMGRKGIGKLSLFSIANRIFVHTRRDRSASEAFLMDAHEIRQTVQQQEAAASADGAHQTPRYHPEPVEFDSETIIGASGTTVRITDLKMRLNSSSVTALRKRVARRFGLRADDFEIAVNGVTVGFTDRDYFGKARFLFQYGDYDYASLCTNLDRAEEGGHPLAFDREARFDINGLADPAGGHRVTGWIAVARRSNDLDDRNDDQDDNLNKITVLMRGKVAQEDILQEYRLGGMITKYIFGEFHADFLDDGEDDIATTSRQRLAEDHPRYIALKNFVEAELRYIWTETNKLKEQREFDTAITSNPHVKRWYDEQPKSLKNSARKIFKGIDVANMDDSKRHSFYATAVLAFEHVKLMDAVERLEHVDASNIEHFLEWLGDMDAIEAARYLEIVRERLAIIDKFEADVDENAYEKILQQYIFDHLWLLDPAWEHATAYAKLEERVQNSLERVEIRNKKEVRPDLQYRRISGAHVIIELKRPGVTVRKSAIEDQVRDYIAAVKESIQKDPDGEGRYPVEAICLV